MPAVPLNPPRATAPAAEPATITRRELAERLQVSVDTVARRRVPGRITALGRIALYHRPTVDAWVAAGCPDPAGWTPPAAPAAG